MYASVILPLMSLLPLHYPLGFDGPVNMDAIPPGEHPHYHIRLAARQLRIEGLAIGGRAGCQPGLLYFAVVIGVLPLEGTTHLVHLIIIKMGHNSPIYTHPQIPPHSPHPRPHPQPHPHPHLPHYHHNKIKKPRNLIIFNWTHLWILIGCFVLNVIFCPFLTVFWHWPQGVFWDFLWCWVKGGYKWSENATNFIIYIQWPADGAEEEEEVKEEKEEVIRPTSLPDPHLRRPRRSDPESVTHYKASWDGHPQRGHEPEAEHADLSPREPGRQGHQSPPPGIH